MKRILAACAAAALSLGLAAMATAGGANAAQARRAPQSVEFWTTNGNNLALGCAAGLCGTGNQVTEVAKPGKLFTFSNDSTFLLDPAGTMQLPNGNFIASNANCNGVVIKASATDTGTVWAIHTTVTGQKWLVSRVCSAPPGRPQDRVIIFSDNTSGDQWGLCENGPSLVNCGTGQFWNLTEGP